jgi:hypothetical protein
MDAYDHYQNRQKKTHDRIGRRRRFAGALPKPGKPEPPYRLIPSDLPILQAFQRHGKLTAPFVAFLVGRGAKKIQERLARMSHQVSETYGGRLLDIPPAQSRSVDARYSDMVYELSDAGKLALSLHDLGNRYAEPERGHFVHALMISLTTAAFEIALTQAGFRFIDAEEIFRTYSPDSTRTSKKPMEIPLFTGSLIHDSLFGADYNGKRRYFVLEAGRRTEQLKQKASDPSTFLHKIATSSQAFDRGLYKLHWGLPRNPLFLSLSSSSRHMENQIEATQGHATNPKRYLFRTQSVFGPEWKVPKPQDMINLVTAPWYTTDEPYYLDRA